MWTGLIWLRMFIAGLIVNMVQTFMYHER